VKFRYISSLIASLSMLQINIRGASLQRDIKQVRDAAKPVPFNSVIALLSTAPSHWLTQVELDPLTSPASAAKE